MDSWTDRSLVTISEHRAGRTLPGHVINDTMLLNLGMKHDRLDKGTGQM